MSMQNNVDLDEYPPPDPLTKEMFAFYGTWRSLEEALEQKKRQQTAVDAIICSAFGNTSMLKVEALRIHNETTVTITHGLPLQS